MHDLLNHKNCLDEPMMQRRFKKLNDINRWAGCLPLVALALMAGCTMAPLEPPGAEVTPTPSETAVPAMTPLTPSPDSASDMTIIPGDRVGSITRDTNRADLADVFGADVLIDHQVDVGEGFTEPATTIDLGGDRTLTVVWTDETRTQLSEIRDLGAAWKTPEGIHRGMTFAELKDILGPFKLYGFAWDYGGTVLLDDSNLEQYSGLMVLRVQPAENAQEQHPEDFQAVIGEELYESTDPHFKPLDLTVSELIVYLEPRTD